MRYRPAPTSTHDGTDIWPYRLIRWLIGETYQPELEADVWIVPKEADRHPDHWPQVQVVLLDGGHIMTGESITTPQQARRLAAMLLAAADKGDRLADAQDQSRIQWEGM
jgi:hypothetical protein